MTLQLLAAVRTMKVHYLCEISRYRFANIWRERTILLEVFEIDRIRIIIGIHRRVLQIHFISIIGHCWAAMRVVISIRWLLGFFIEIRHSVMIPWWRLRHFFGTCMFLINGSRIRFLFKRGLIIVGLRWLFWDRLIILIILAGKRPRLLIANTGWITKCSLIVRRRLIIIRNTVTAGGLGEIYLRLLIPLMFRLELFV